MLVKYLLYGNDSMRFGGYLFAMTFHFLLKKIKFKQKLGMLLIIL